TVREWPCCCRLLENGQAILARVCEESSSSLCAHQGRTQLRRNNMKYRSLALAVLALAMVLWAGAPVLAADEQIHEGKIVKVADGKLTMTDKDGKNEHTHMVPATTLIKCDGKECKLEDLKEGFTVKVTTNKSNP